MCTIDLLSITSSSHEHTNARYIEAGPGGQKYDPPQRPMQIGSDKPKSLPSFSSQKSSVLQWKNPELAKLGTQSFVDHLELMIGCMEVARSHFCLETHGGNTSKLSTKEPALEMGQNPELCSRLNWKHTAHFCFMQG